MKLRIAQLTLALTLGLLLTACSGSKLLVTQNALKPEAINMVVTLVDQIEVSSKLTASDPDGNPVTFSLGEKPGKGTLTLSNSETGEFRYVKKEGAAGFDYFTFQVTDGQYTSEFAKVTVVLDNDSLAQIQPATPFAQAANLATEIALDVDSQLVGEEPHNQPLVFWIDSPPQNGQITHFDHFTGSFTYEPNAGFLGNDFFTFRVMNSYLASPLSVVQINVAEETFPHQNPENPCDVNADGFISPRDALYIINHLNGDEGSSFLDRRADPAGIFLDVNGDNIISPSDALAVIQYLNEGT